MGKVNVRTTSIFYTREPVGHCTRLRLAAKRSVRILHPPSSILHPPSSILYPLSSILHPLSSILHPLSSILYPLSSILYPLSSIYPRLYAPRGLRSGLAHSIIEVCSRWPLKRRALSVRLRCSMHWRCWRNRIS